MIGSDTRVPHDQGAEEAVVGCLLLTPIMLAKLTGEAGLKPEHFYVPTLRRMFAVMIELEEATDPIDNVTVAAECSVQDQSIQPHEWNARVEAMLTRVPSLAHALHYAERVVECAHLRDYQAAGYGLIESAGLEDWEQIKAIEGKLLTGGPLPAHSYNPEQVGDLLFDYLDSHPEVFPTPWPRLNKLIHGGLRRGALTLISGYTSHGKSVIADQILEHAAIRLDLRAHLYINEMTPEERALRTLARLADVSFSRLESEPMQMEEARKVVARLGHMPFGITDCAGWTAQDLARDIRRRKWDIAAIDIFHKLPGGNLTTELDEKSRVLNEVPKVSQANCHILLCAHVSKPTVRDGIVPPPNGANLRGTGSLENDADNVLFVHRDQNDATGRKLNSGIAYFTKVRNGTPGRISVEFNGDRMRFVEAVSKTENTTAEPRF
jgi:replicative DNA helicase